MDEEKKVESFESSLSDKIWLTKRARFTASRRMKRNKISSNTAMAMLSFQIIAINLLTFLPAFEKYSNRITVITIILSGFTLVLTLLISLMQYEKRETNYHQCGIELDNLNQELRLKISEKIQFDDTLKKDFLNRYISILEKYNLNHTTFDYQYSEKKLCSFSRFVRWYVFDINTFYWLLFCLFPIISLLIILNSEKLISLFIF